MGALVFALGVSTTVAAQSNDPLLQSYYAFMGNHPAAASALQADPSLYRSRSFMDQHPQVQSYLLQHPAQYQQLMSQAPRHPDPDTTALNKFLVGHPAIAQSLNANPALSTDPMFLNQHPTFRKFLQQHPVEQRRLATRGYNFEHYTGGIPGHPADISGAPSWDSRQNFEDDDDGDAYRHHRHHHRGHEMAEAEEEGEELEAHEHHHEHHDHGKHLGWYKHHGHHRDEDHD
jgi:hypothetical protein